MGVKPIPKKNLVHSAILIDQKTGEQHEINHVLFQVKRGVMYSTVSGEEIVSYSYMYVDYKNSEYPDIALFTGGNVIVYNGHRYTIKNTNYLVAFKDHHLEVLLV